MKSERTLGITLFSISLFYYPIWWSFKIVSSALERLNLSIIIETNYFQLLSILPQFIVSGVLLVIIFGVYKLKRWGYYMLLIFLGIIFCLNSVILSLNLFAEAFLFSKYFILSVAELIYFVSIVLYFTSKKISMIYLGKSFKQDVLEDKWSLGLLVFSWMLMLLSILSLAKEVTDNFELTMSTLAGGWLYWLISFVCSVGIFYRKEVMRKAYLFIIGFSVLVSVLSVHSNIDRWSIMFQAGLLVFFLTRPKVVALFS